jgi:hypothetical protein
VLDFNAIAQGDPHAAGQLLPLLYDELRKSAVTKLAQEKPGLTLDTTALVHEAYLRLLGNDPDKPWQSRRRFIAGAAEAMRQLRVLSEIIAFAFAIVIMGSINQPRPMHLVENCWFAARVISVVVPSYL